MDIVVGQLRNLILNQDLQLAPQSQPHLQSAAHSIASATTTTTTTTVTLSHFFNSPNKFISHLLSRYWWLKPQSQRNRTLIYVLALTTLSIYVLLPSLPLYRQHNSKMFSKRPDKHTTGLINLRNDCFANSSLQAYSSLPSLTEYLNHLILSFHQLSDFINEHHLDVDELIRLRLEHNKSLQNSKFKSSNAKFTIPLHLAMANMVKKLQETQMTSKTISVWTFLHELENIFQAKISKSQHDAHELTQLVNETLENENLKLKSFHKYILTNLHRIVPKGEQPSPQDYTELESIHIPEFPFDGLIMGQMVCFSCHGVSKPNFTPFVILTLPTPNTTQCDLEKLLEDNESETIEGYQCLKCRIDKIVANEQEILRQNQGQPRTFASPEEEEFINEIFRLHQGNLCINEDIPEPLEKFIKSYNVNGLDVSKITSTVSKKSHILKPPKIFGLHLSRSKFDGQSVTRNSCMVHFKDSMTLSIGKEYHEKLRDFQQYVQDEEATLIKNLSSKVLTTDENDMEDEEVQRDDFEEKGNEDEEDDLDDGDTTDVGEGGSTTEGDTDFTDDGGDDGDEDEDEDEAGDEGDDQSSLTSAESVPQTITTSSTIRPNEGDSDGQAHTINKAPISAQQTEKLKEQFKKFKFNENDVYKYRLRAIIKHIGSHTQGHYECYKHKPLYVKNSEGNIFKLTPEITDIAGDTHCDVTPVEQPETEKENDEKKDAPEKRSRFSLRSPSVSSGSQDNDEGLRHKFSNLMGRRPSVIQANPRNVEEILQSGLQTPAEILVDDPMKTESHNNFDNAFAQAHFKNSFQENNSGQGANNDTSKSAPQKKVKMKKINSIISHPYWRISDAQVDEVSRATVLAEETSVYMLYYERVDRKQIKHSRKAK
ncbi:conserved hypothetical protein [Lodderomyces elongisporus NRRL YB-4239]|uniref:USP domain-containing protein n=1 Tax=Lodderomyces elongisporus (strain ATCC 11503 / CBS 2605 / JCM 1781 / NBRC 1676 / NRRL YB-4239) TaxID=379508 RepID=A5DWC1_LODEL|nr:conserved hypothetical protein [Lodderomyces elongisporus NRRL YB-4239]